jgi:hypothetical protein
LLQRCGAGQGESATIDKTGQNKSDKAEPVGRDPANAPAKDCTRFPNDSRCRPTNTGSLPDEVKEAQGAMVGCMLTFVPHVGGPAKLTYLTSTDPWQAAQKGPVEAQKNVKMLPKIFQIISRQNFPNTLRALRKGRRSLGRLCLFRTASNSRKIAELLAHTA